MVTNLLNTVTSGGSTYVAFETAGALAVLILGFIIVRKIVRKLAN